MWGAFKRSSSVSICLQHGTDASIVVSLYHFPSVYSVCILCIVCILFSLLLHPMFSIGARFATVAIRCALYGVREHCFVAISQRIA